MGTRNVSIFFSIRKIKFVQRFLTEVGYIQYCIADETGEKIDIDDEWQGQINKTEQHIKRSERNIIAAVT